MFVPSLSWQMFGLCYQTARDRGRFSYRSSDRGPSHRHTWENRAIFECCFPYVLSRACLGKMIVLV
jgi:hypothetical protein